MKHLTSVKSVCMQLYAWPGLVFVALLGGCNAITSTQINSFETRQPIADGISYFLPKSMLRATVVEAADKSRNIIVEKFDTQDETLHFLASVHLSAFSSDIINIETTNSGLLKAVTTDLTDQTVENVEKFSKLLFSSITGVPTTENRKLPDGAGIPAATLLSIEFDPFVPGQLVDANQKLAKYGYCIVVAGESNPLPGNVCERVLSNADDTQFESPYGSFVAAHSHGLYYRRPIYERVHIFRKKSDGYSEVWSSVETFANRSALLEVRLDRRAFIRMNTVLTFDAGVLTKVEITKPSEVLASLSLPITILDAVLKLPILRIQKIEADNGLRERELNARQKEIDLKAREIAIREQELSNANRSTFIVQGAQPPRALTPDERQLLLDRCDGTFGTQQQCQADIGLKQP